MSPRAESIVGRRGDHLPLGAARWLCRALLQYWQPMRIRQLLADVHSLRPGKVDSTAVHKITQELEGLLETHKAIEEMQETTGEKEMVPPSELPVAKITQSRMASCDNVMHPEDTPSPKGMESNTRLFPCACSVTASRSPAPSCVRLVYGTHTYIVITLTGTAAGCAGLTAQATAASATAHEMTSTAQPTVSQFHLDAARTLASNSAYQ